MRKFFFDFFRMVVKFPQKYFYDKTDLLILDSFFPHPLSEFRYVEFDTYLHSYRTLVYTTGDDLSCVGEKNIIEFYINQYPGNRKVKLFKRERKINAKLAVIVFLNNAFSFLPYLEENKIPFIFTLYPGGGFKIKDKDCELKLNIIFNSPYFKKVIVTQNITQNYLINNSFCKKEHIEFIYGAPFNCEAQEFLYKSGKKEKESFDICFVAAKYMINGKDKGYDIFVEVIRKLSTMSDKFKFHVVGGFTENDIDVSDMTNNLKFYGYLSIKKLREFYLNQDIIISPNRANVLSEGAFDGFPTASVVEAGLCRVVMFVTDELNQNIILTNNKDCVFINHDPDYIVSKVMELFNDRNKLFHISQEGSIVLRKVFSNDHQMAPRLNLVSKYLNN